MKTFEIEAKRIIGLTQEDIDDIVCMAFEGGINYWCCGARVVGEYLGEYASDQISRGGAIKLYDAESDDVWELTLDKFLEGLRMWLEDYANPEMVINSGYLDSGAIDAGDADNIIQLALFNDVIFG